MNQSQRCLSFLEPIRPSIRTRGVLAHRHDPETSHEAAKVVNRDGTRSEQKRIVLQAVIRFGGRTSKELSALAGLDRHMVGDRHREIGAP